MKRILPLLVFCFSFFSIVHAQPVSYHGENPDAVVPPTKYVQHATSRSPVETSDTIDILHYNIHLTIGDIHDQNIAGSCVIEFKSKMDNVNQLLLDLLNLQVDSVKQNGLPLLFSRPTTKVLAVNLQGSLLQGDSSAVEVYYHGHPGNDGTFGGFFFKDSASYNFGISIQEIPHNFAHTWYPCIDNFRERATYEIHVTARSSKSVVSGGMLVDSVNNGDGTFTWNWKLDHNIPAYLSSVDVSNFSPLRGTLSGINGPVPYLLAAAPKDTANTRKEFLHLPDAFSMLEQHFGPYRFDKVGFSIVPFDGGGAMEHAGNIGYPIAFLDGKTTYEYLAYHELAHQWFGNLVTPRTAEDVWMKEGFAVYCEKLFYESVYGRPRYETEVMDNHERVLRLVHVQDGGYLALSPMPQTITYGRTTYLKGADVVHTLRSYMGDTSFFNCLKGFLQDNQYSAQTSYSLRDYLSTCSGKDMSDFFDDWIFAPGFPHFSIDSFEVAPTSDNRFDVTVHIRQRLNNAPHLYHHVPLEVTFMDKDMTSITETVMVNGSCTVYKVSLPFPPAFACTDLKDKISDAITDNYRIIKNTGNNNFVYGKMNLTVQTVTDSAFMRIEHNFIPPDSMKHRIKNLHLSQERYWRVDGIFPTGFDTKGTIAYSTDLDGGLITTSEDSMRVMYRPSVSADWVIESDVTQNFNTVHNDGKGSFVINHLKKGEYAFAIMQPDKKDSVISYPEEVCNTFLSDNDITNETGEIKVFPNPSSNNFTIEGNLKSDCSLEIFNLIGQRIFTQNLSMGPLKYSVNTEKFNGEFSLSEFLTTTTS